MNVLTRRPAVVLYWDIDNTLAPLSPVDLTGWGGHWRTTRAGSYDLTYSPELIRRVGTLATLPGVESVWLTGWEEHAQEYFCAHTGLAGQHWPVITGIFGDAVDDWWKLRAMKAEVAAMPGVPRVWLDDDLSMERQPRAVQWAEENGILVICPEKGKGISPEEIQDVEAFVHLQLAVDGLGTSADA